jgi:carbonic anhydrase
MKAPMTVSKQQIEDFKATLGFANNRPVQPVNSRMILK